MGFPYYPDNPGARNIEYGTDEDENGPSSVSPNFLMKTLRGARKNLVKAKNAIVRKIPRWNRRNRDEYASLDEVPNVIAPSHVKCSNLDLTVVTAAILIVLVASLILFSLASLIHYMINTQ